MSEANPTTPAAQQAAGPTQPIPHAGLRYGLLRIALLLVTGAVLYLVGLRGWGLAFAAVLGSAVLSFFVLLRPREEAARNIEVALEHRQAKGLGATTEAQDVPAADGAPSDAPGAAAPEPPSGQAQQQA